MIARDRKKPGMTFRTIPARAVSLDVGIFAVLLAALNLHLLGIGNAVSWVFYPARVAAGDWWRLLTHPFVHVSAYHLALDAGAFLLLFADLDAGGRGRRWMVTALCGAASLAGTVLFASDLDAVGLCGLSGTAHGLMAYAGLEIAGRRRERWIGCGMTLLVGVKSLLEASTGRVLFEALHMGMCGTPIAVSHLAGVAGGLLAFALYRIARIPNRCRQPAAETRYSGCQKNVPIAGRFFCYNHLCRHQLNRNIFLASGIDERTDG